MLKFTILFCEKSMMFPMINVVVEIYIFFFLWNIIDF